MSYIVLLDPSLMDHNGNLSTNLGDLIINDAVIKIITELFPNKEIIKIASHVALEEKHQQLINNAEFAFVGGTNLFVSNYAQNHLLKLKPNNDYLWLFPGVKNLIFLGVGWGEGYGRPLTFKTKIFYKRLLNADYIQSARDKYSAQKINSTRTCVNTSCPTLWNMNGANTNRVNTSTKECLLTLTDYSPDVENDTKLIDLCFNYFDKISFFPQGHLDKNYITELDIYKQNKAKIEILPHSMKTYKEYVAHNDYTFVGTRLHGGIKCIQEGRSALIMGVDNRATEIGKDVNLGVVKRNDYATMKRWLDGEKVFNPLNIPLHNIHQWKNQFN